MSDKSGIAWTDATWNPTTGCTKVSPGCKFCYAKHQAWPRLAAMKTGVYTGRKFEDVQVHPERLDQPLRWTKPRMIFVNSMSDLFHEDIPFEFIDRVFAVMALSTQHIFQVLTKRPKRMLEWFTQSRSRAPLAECFAELYVSDVSTEIARRWPFNVQRAMECSTWPVNNVWLGVSVENQATADERIPLLLETPAAVRWLSCEPLLDSIDLSKWIGDRPQDVVARRNAGLSYERSFIHWVVVGGESGPNARPMKAGWAQNLMLECRDSSTPFFMKQGSQTPEWPKYHDIKTFRFNLQVREYPTGHK